MSIISIDKIIDYVRVRTQVQFFVRKIDYIYIIKKIQHSYTIFIFSIYGKNECERKKHIIEAILKVVYMNNIILKEIIITDSYNFFQQKKWLTYAYFSSIKYFHIYSKKLNFYRHN